MAVKHALLVDDSRSARFALGKLLEKNDIQVDMAESGEEALNYLNQQLPDVVFMDHMMPGMNGLETAQAIRSNPATQQIPIVMCTSNDEEKYMQEALGQSIAGILPKPATQAQLQTVLQRLNTALLQPTSRPAVKAAAPVAASPVSGSHSADSFSRKDLEQLAENIAQQVVQARTPELVKGELKLSLAELRTELLKSIPAPITQPLDAGLSEELRDEVRRIAQEESEQATLHMLEERAAQTVEREFSREKPQLLSEVEQKIGQTREQLLKQLQAEQEAFRKRGIDDVTLSILSDKSQNQINQALNPLKSELEQSFNHKLDKLAQEFAERLEQVAEQLSEQLSERVRAELQADVKKLRSEIEGPKTLDSALLDEVKLTAESVARNSLDSSRKLAETAARETAEAITRQVLSSAPQIQSGAATEDSSLFEQHLAQLDIAQEQLRKQNLLSLGLAGAAVAAAIIAILL